MLAQRVSSINSISAICEKAGANVDEVAVAIGQDSRLGPKFLKSGLGFGGSCFKKDLLSLIYLARSLGLDEVGDYWQQVLTMNEYQQSRFVDRAISTLNGTIEGRKIAILGYTFKKNTSDQRGSLAIDAIQRISAANPNQIVIFDPWCRPSKIELTSAFTATGPRLHSGIEVCRNAYAACKDACAVFILTDWDQFRYPPVALAQIVVPDGLHGLNAGPHEHLSEPVREQEHIYAATERVNWSVISGIMRKPKMVFDGRGIIDDVQKMEQLGFMVESVGKPSRVPVS